jgi:hypothetical protein
MEAVRKISSDMYSLGQLGLSPIGKNIKCLFDACMAYLSGFFLDNLRCYPLCFGQLVFLSLDKRKLKMILT